MIPDGYPGAVRGFRAVIFALALISLGINLLLLASPLYMLQVFDRVLSGRSLETLLILTIAVLFALAVMGGLDACRSLILVRLGDWLDGRLGRTVMAASLKFGAQPGARASAQPFADLSSIRGFLASPGVGAIFDAPMMPLFLAVIWLVHPYLGAVALGSALVLALLTLAGEMFTRGPMARSAQAGDLAGTTLNGALGAADTAQSMGLGHGLGRRWEAMREDHGRLQVGASSLTGTLGSLTKAIRLAVQSLILGTGAYLVLSRDITPGEMIAASILLSRALAPIEVAIGSWRHFVNARQAWQRLRSLLAAHAQLPRGLALPRPEGRVTLDRVVLTPGQGTEPVLRAVSFDLPAGQALGVLGPSGSGKSSLARVLVGAWRPGAGSVRLDGAELGQWDPEALGRHVGYLPQSGDLFPGTVRDNIARFGEADLDDVVAAARLAGAHQTILGLPGGYNCEVGARGDRLSGGQRQRVALARAVFGAPRLVVLDEPDANLDQEGFQGLQACIAALKADGATVVIVAHRRNAVLHCDRLMLLEQGRVTADGPAAEIAERLRRSGAAPLRAVGREGGT